MRMNAVRLLNGTTVNGAESSRFSVQGVRDEVISFWFFFGGNAGSSATIRGSPDTQASALTSPVEGMTLFTVITTGTAAAGQVKTNTAGHAFVVLQALPIMWVRFQNALSPTDSCFCWLIE